MNVIKKIAVYLWEHNANMTGLFVLAFFFAWLSNGNIGTHYDVGELMTAYGVVAGVSVTRFGVSSALNSPRGQAPQKN